MLSRFFPQHRYPGELVDMDNPPERWQRQRIMRLFNNWVRRVVTIERVMPRLTPEAQANLEEWFEEWDKDKEPRLRALQAKHLHLDKTDPEFGQMTSHGMAGLTLRGLDDPKTLTDVWKETEEFDKALRLTEFLIDSNLKASRNRATSTPAATAADAPAQETSSPEGSTPTEEES